MILILLIRKLKFKETPVTTLLEAESQISWWPMASRTLLSIVMLLENVDRKTNYFICNCLS